MPSILLVDDDADTRSLMCEALARRGFDVDTVDSAEACLERFETSPPTIVVTDVQMPGMSGIELCGRLHELLPEIVVVVMSGLEDTATKRAAKVSGAFTFLHKPVSMGALDLVLRDALHSVQR